ncbi:MAG: efflux RND transporter periplasmic adaptor subunit [Alphaproteobacteria bacterium]
MARRSLSSADEVVTDLQPKDRPPEQVPPKHAPAEPAPATRPPRRRKKPLALAIGLILLLAIGAGLAWKTWFATPAATVMTSPVVIGDIEKSVLATGILKPSKLVAVGAQVSGRITSVPVELGQKVEEGALLADIDSTTQSNELRTAKAALASMRAQRVEKEASLVLAEQTLARQQRMVAQKAVSQADVESAEAEVKITEAQITALDAEIDEAEVAVETAEANLGYTRITAPIDGTVLALVSQEGQTVNATQSAPTIVILGQLEHMTVRAEISEADVVGVTPGQPVYFTILGEPDQRYEAVLGSIEPAPESITSDSSFSSSTSSSSTSSASSSSSAIYYNGIFTVPNPDGRLRTYMTAEVHIVLGRATSVLTMPATALGQRHEDGSYDVVVISDDGRKSTRRVEIGLNDRITAEVRSGLNEGERVVTGELSGEEDSDTRSGPMGPPPGF